METSKQAGEQVVRWGRGCSSNLSVVIRIDDEVSAVFEVCRARDGWLRANRSDFSAADLDPCAWLATSPVQAIGIRIFGPNVYC